MDRKLRTVEDGFVWERGDITNIVWNDGSMSVGAWRIGAEVEYMVKLDETTSMPHKLYAAAEVFATATNVEFAIETALGKMNQKPGEA